jgi:hypothetical protein
VRRSRIGTSISRPSSRVEQHRDAEDDPISFRRQRPGQGEREEHGDHHGTGGEDHAAGVGQAADHRLARVVAAVPVLLPLSARLAVSRAVDAYGKAERPLRSAALGSADLLVRCWRLPNVDSIQVRASPSDVLGRPRVGEVTIGADQPHLGSMCEVTRVQRLFRGWHVVDGDVDGVLREEALDDVASAEAVRVGCWSLEQQHLMPDAAADVEVAGALMGEREATEGRAFAGTRPIATDAFMGDGGAGWVGDPDL